MSAGEEKFEPESPGPPATRNWKRYVRMYGEPEGLEWPLSEPVPARPAIHQGQRGEALGPFASGMYCFFGEREPRHIHHYWVSERYLEFT